MKNLLLIIFAIVLSFPIMGQYKSGLIPRESPMKKFSSTIGYTEVTIKYSSPAVRNRKIWGDLVPYNEIWRAGANEATKVTFSKSVVIEGYTLEAGSYALFMIPRAEEPWTIIFNKVADQWGAFNYKQEFDVVRTEIMPRFNVNYQEDLKYEIKDLHFEQGIVRMLWENIELDIEFNREILPDLIQNIESTVLSSPSSEQWVIYLQGAEFLVNRKRDLDYAYKWIKLSEKLFDNTSLEIKAKSDFYLGHIYWGYSKYYYAIDNEKEAMNYWLKMKTIDNENGYYTKGIGPEKAEEFRNFLTAN